MWARNFEFTFGIWLALSPFIFAVDPSETAIWIVNFGTAGAIWIIALVSYWPPSGKIHLLNGALGFGLIVFAFVQPVPVSAAHQNHVVIGLLLAMFAIIPSRASEPPKRWREYYSRKQT